MGYTLDWNLFGDFGETDRFFRIWWDVGSIITKENSYAFRSIWVWGITKYFKHGVDTCKGYSTELFQLTTLGVVQWGPSDADRTQVGPMLLRIVDDLTAKDLDEKRRLLPLMNKLYQEKKRPRFANGRLYAGGKPVSREIINSFLSTRASPDEEEH